MSRKLKTAVSLLGLAVLLACLWSAPAGSARSTNHTLRFKVVKRTHRYVVVKRHQHRVVVHHGTNLVKVGGVVRYRVTKRAHTSYLLRRVRSTPPVVPAPTGSVFNVKDYGASPNDATGDTNAVRAAVKAASAAGGGTVSIPAGTYYLDYGSNNPEIGPSNNRMHALIEVKSNVTIKGAGSGSTVLQNSCGNNYTSTFGGYQATGWGIEGVRLVTTNPSCEDGLKLFSCTNGHLTDVWSGTDPARAGRFYTNYMFYDCTGLTLTDVVSDGSRDVPFAFDNWSGTTSNVTLRGCQSLHSPVCGFYVYNSNVSSGNTGSSQTKLNNVWFQGCTAKDNAQSGFYFNVTEHCEVTNCSSTGNGYAYYLASSTNAYVPAAGGYANTASGNDVNAVPTNGGGSTFRSAL